jgi:cation transport regulator ChaB
MPYPTLDSLPDWVKKMPKHAQQIYQAAWNSAFEQYNDEGKAAATAISAIKTKYEQDNNGEWHLKAASAEVYNFPGRIVAASVDNTNADYGWRWEVQIINAGEDKQGGAIYPLSVLHAAASLYENAPVFALSEGQHSSGKHPFGNSVRDLVGRVKNVHTNPMGLGGKLIILKASGNKWLRDALVDAHEQGMIGEHSTNDILGLSHDTMGIVAMQGGKRVAQKIAKVKSVDIVYEPIAGGKFIRMAAAAQAAGRKTEENEMIKKLLAALKLQRPDLKEQIEAIEAKGDAATEEEMQSLLASAVAMPGDKKDEVKEYLDKLTASLTDNATKHAKELVAEATKKFEDTQKLLACTSTLIESLEHSGLPEIVKARVRRQYEGKVFEPVALTASIKEEKEMVDKLTSSGIPTGVGALRTDVLEGEAEKLQAALDKLLGGDVDPKFKDVPAFTSLRGAYVRLTGDPELRGLPSREGMALGEKFMNMMRLPAAYSTSSFSFVLGNSMYRRLLKEYARVNYQEEALISFYRSAENFKTLEIIQVGYFGDVPDVNPETGDYKEITMPTDIEATYAVNQKGWLLTVTRRVLLNDDLKTVSQLVAKMGRAHRRTHARRAWNKVINNATFKGDSVALFDAAHGNLGAVALTADTTGVTTLTNRLKAMYAQTEQDSAEGLALIPLYLWVPREVKEIAETLNSPWPGAAAPNPHAGRFGANHERIITNPLFTDVNDWGLIANGNDVELLEAAYINGQREPEFFVADNPLVGQMFVADKIQYKSRHEFEFEIADYRGFDKSVCA